MIYLWVLLAPDTSTRILLHIDTSNHRDDFWCARHQNQLIYRLRVRFEVLHHKCVDEMLSSLHRKRFKPDTFEYTLKCGIASVTIHFPISYSNGIKCICAS